MTAAPQSRPDQAEELRREGRRLLAGGDREGAVEVWSQAADLGNGLAAFQLGQVLLELRRPADAAAAFDRAAGLGGPNELSNIGVLLEARGEVADAEAAWKLARERGSALAALNLGGLLEARGDWLGARDAYAAAGPEGDEHVARLDSGRRRALEQGSRGGDVRQLQSWLRELGFKVEPDGFFGHATADAVRGFQERRGLVADGVVGPRTWSEIELTPSVRGAAERLTGEVTAAAFVAEIIRQHPEYGGKRAARLELDRETGARAGASEWLRRVREHLNPSIAPRLHGRAVIAGLARIDEDARRQLARDGFLPALEAEIDPPLDTPTLLSAGALAGYVSDAVPAGRRLTDRLGVEGEANALAGVLIAKDVRPPLSVGLFGDWGTGKSFFMGLMQQHIDDLTKLARERDGGSAYCGHVRQITFNAWHYADANLWASLVTRIFEGLAEPGQDRTTIIGALETTRRQREAVQARATAATLAREQAEREIVELKQCQDVATRQHGAIASTSAVADVARDPSVEEATKQVEKTLQQDAGSATLELIQTAGSLRRLAVAGRLLWRELRAMYGTWVVPVAVVAVILLVALIALAIAQPRWLALVLGWLAGVVSLVRGPAASVRKAEALISGSLEHAQTRMKASEEAAQRKADAAAEAERAAHEELEEIRSGRQLETFITERASASEYRARLGLIAAVREDFERLTALLADGDGTAAVPDMPRIERVVLYIDDLDRCPAERVVEVLEAVHLLLAFELFVVVVGVDSRWLLNSLRLHYAAQLARDDDRQNDDAAHWDSTPQNYLEKIFQIPYVLRRMDNPGFGRLVADLLGAADNGRAPSRPAGGTRKPPPRAPSNGPPKPRAAARPQRNDALVDPIPDGPRPPIDLRPAALQFTGAEIEFLAGLRDLVTTPRATKRLANTYRLLRAGLSGARLERFTGADGGPGEYREVLIALAVLAHSSSFGGLLLAATDAVPDDAAWHDLVDPLPDAGDSLATAVERAEWERFARALADATEGHDDPPSVRHLKDWSPKVARFSFLV